MILALAEEIKERADRRSELRHLLRACGFEPPGAVALNFMLSTCPDVDLAFTALTMDPRPGWVKEIAGPLRW
jgi:hypothetical protein